MQIQYNCTFLESIPFFSGLGEAILEKLCACSTIKEYRAGEILYYEKDEDENLYFILDGGLKFFKVDRFDSEIFLYQLESNSFVFDVAKFCDESFFICYANAEFTMDSRVINFDSKKFRQILKSTPALMERVLKEALLSISTLQCIINRDVVFDGTAKVAHMLTTNLEEFNRLKKHEIAYMLHIQPETLSRILRKFTRSGIISIKKNSISINDIDSLYKIYN